MVDGICGTIAFLGAMIMVTWIILFGIAPFFWWAIMWDAGAPLWYTETLMWRWLCWGISGIVVAFVAVGISNSCDKQ